MNKTNCPITNKVTNKLVSDLQDILVRLEAKDQDARLDFLKFRSTIIKRFNKDVFKDVLNKANGGSYVQGLYVGSSYQPTIPGSDQTDRSVLPKPDVEGNFYP